ncbi:ABC transporter [Popillia japonica]|uniref:ABC transporter n=1 Tax=Popillia japonica TaxID=7064 RepID=A0AAW1IW40_POPJA
MTVAAETENGKLKCVDIHFSELSFHANKKCLLHGISGEFLGGQLTGILGASGAGKSTLLNILAGQVHFGASGNIYINGEPRNNKLFHKISSYIMQDDMVQPRLTVRELISSATELKLGSHYTQRAKDLIIEDVLSSMRLENCIDTRTEHLSGGQRKRLCIALELVNNPPVVFLDEPTTGLDDVSTKQCISLLKSLAEKGKTIICTIHQPSNTVFELFDQVYFLSEGNCVFSGSTESIVPYLAGLGMPCPDFYSPADYLIELVQNEKCAVSLKNQSDKEIRIKDHNRNYSQYANPYAMDGVTNYVYAVTFWKLLETVLDIIQKKITTNQ